MDEWPLTRCCLRVCCCAYTCVQRHCPSCGRWRLASSFARHATCGQCQSAVQREQRELASLPSLPPSPPPAPSPSPTLLARPTGCIDPLTIEQRAAIVALHKLHMAHKDIARQIPCSENAVTRWVHRWEEEHSVQDRERSGRPRCTDDDTDASIAEFAEEKKFTTPRAITAELALDCSPRTTRRRLDEAGLHGRVARSVPMWTAAHIRSRLSFAEGYAGWGEAEWERVIFSDETHIELSPHGQLWVQRPVGAEFDPEYVVPRKLHSELTSPTLLTSLAHSMPSRLAAVRANHGYYAGY